MIGVVIWSSEASQKAVIWCEDQGPLAYLRGGANLVEDTDWPVPGDLLRLECETIGNLRHAHSVSLISAKACPQLPDALLGHTNRPASHLKLVSERSEDEVKSDSAKTQRREGRYPSAINV